MKNLLFILAIGAFSLTSCHKEDIGPYVDVPEETQNPPEWDSGYEDGGTLPNGGSQPTTNDLVGTQWVLTKLVSAFATEYPNDTLTFVDNTHYTLNNGAVRNYQLSNIPNSNNKDLSLYFFAPFGGSHYSGQVGLYFVDDGEINNVEFEDIQDQSTTIRAWFQKL